MHANPKLIMKSQLAKGLGVWLLLTASAVAQNKFVSIDIYDDDQSETIRVTSSSSSGTITGAVITATADAESVIWRNDAIPIHPSETVYAKVNLKEPVTGGISDTFSL